jgi:hypothetical protein
MRKRYQVFWLILTAWTALSFGLPVNASTYRSFLRINKVYVLYTDPIVPHADAQGNFWVGLQPFASLIGAQFDETQDGSASLTLGRHKVVFMPGEATAVLDGKPIRLPVAAKRIGPSHHIVIPLQPLLAAFDLHSQWDKHYHILTLTDTNLVDKGLAGEFAGFIAQFEGPPSEPVAQAKAFVGPPYLVSPVVPTALTQNGMHLVWRLYNASSRSCQLDMNLLTIGQAGEEIEKSGIPFPSSFPNPPTYYHISTHRNLDFDISIADTITNDPHDIDPTNPGIVAVVKHQHKAAAVVAWVVL